MIHGTVKDQRIVAVLHQFFEEEVGFGLLIDEDENTALVIPHSQDLQEPQELRGLLPDLDDLFDIHASLPTAPHDHFNRPAKDLLRKVLYVLGECCREHYSLSVRTDIVHDFGDLRFEAKIEHAICLVDHDHRNTAKVRDLAVVEGQHIDHTTGRAY